MSQQIADNLGRIVRVTVVRIINIIKGTVADFYSSEVPVLRYDSLKLMLFGEIRREIGDFVTRLDTVLVDELGFTLNYSDYEYIISYSNVIADTTAGQIFWRIFGWGTKFYSTGERRKKILETIDFFDSVVYNILMDGLYKLVRFVVFHKLLTSDPNQQVAWYSMNGKFKHPLCKKRHSITAPIHQVETVFATLHEKRYNFLHPHFLCDGIFMPVPHEE